MAEELQNLLERIQKDGVDKARSSADEIISAAGKKASEIISRAEADAKALLTRAEKDSQSFVEHGKKSLEQAGRDLVLSVRDAVTRTFEHILQKEITAALNTETLQKMLVQVVEAFRKTQETSSAFVLQVPEAQQKALTQFLSSKFQDALRKGMEIRPDSSVAAGFRITLKDKHLEHDFSEQAIAEAMSRVLRPHIAQLLNKPK